MELKIQKTILLPIYHGMRAKNFFYTDTYRELILDKQIRLVVVAPSMKMEYYKKTFQEPNVLFESLDIDPNKEPLLGKLLAEFAFNVLDTNTIRFKQRLQYLQYGNFPRFLFKRTLNRVFGHVTFVRRIVRALDTLVPVDPRVTALLEKYKPAIVLAPDIVFPIDRFFLRAAKKGRYFTVGLMRSWDNITAKGVIQILPDKLILHTTRLKRLAIKYADMPEKDIIVTGPPDFDDYFKPMAVSREDFFKKLGIPPARKILFFSPFFDSFTGSAVIMLQGLVRGIEEGKLPSDLHILVRHRPGLKDIPSRLTTGNSHVTVTYPCSTFFYGKKGKKERIIDWEFSAQDVDLLVHSIYYSDVTITTVSTLAIDAAVCDRPIIGIRFDAAPNCKPEHSVKEIANLHDHYREIERTGGIRLVKNMEELIQSINTYLEHPELDHIGRMRIAEEQVEFFDGKNGKRAADAMRSMLELM